MSIDVLKNLQIKAFSWSEHVSWLNTFNITKEKEDYLIGQPHVLAVSKITERSYVYKGNHRMAVLLNEDVSWVLLKVNYFFLNDDHDKKFNLIPRLVNGNWPTVPKPSVLGFETRPV